MKLVTTLLAAGVWLYLLHVLRRAELPFWRFLLGSVGLFLFLMVVAQPVLTMPLARAVSSLAGVVGTLSRTFTAYFKYGIMFIETAEGSLTLQVDFECSGVIEIFAFLSLLAFFPVYERNEKFTVGVVGTAYIIVCNATRITLICLATHFWGTEVYYVMHTIVGRLFFYGMSILLYFYVFTRPQVIQIKVGSFTYGHSEKNP